MLSIFTLLFFALSSGVDNSTSPTMIADRITWNYGSELTYNDFRASLPFLSTKAAATNFEISFDYTLRGDDFYYTVNCNFVRDLSWMRPEGKTPYILNHEQKHFDLAEAYARLLRKRLSEADINHANHQAKTDEIYNSVWNACIKKQAEYDSDTGHSLHHSTQHKWDQRINDLLEKYKDYAI